MSKQFIFLVLITALGTVAPLAGYPMIGVLVYYFYAILRPNFLWQWVLQDNTNWSTYVAVTTTIAALARLLGFGVQSVPVKGIRWSLVHYLVLIYIGWLSVTYYNALNKDVAYPWMIENLKVLLMLFVSSVLVRTSADLWRLYLVAAFSEGYIGWEANMLYLQRGGFNIRVHGFGYYDNNGAGLIFAMGIPLCFFAFEGTRRWWRWVYLGFVPPLMHAALMSFSRGSMVAMICVTPLVLYRSRFRMRAVPLAAIFLAVAVPVMAGKEIRERFSTVKEYETDGSSNSRYMSWNAAIRIAADYPIFGVGTRNSNLLSYSYGADIPGRTIHNQYLQVMADNGYPGLFFYVLVLLATFWACWRVLKATKGRTDPKALQSRAIACGCESALVIFCVGAVFLSLETFELTYLVLLLAGQVAVVEDSIMDESREQVPFPAFAAAAA